jgi:hypothetical protein
MRDRVLFGAAAVALFALAGVFGWRDLGLGLQPLVLIAAVLAAGIAVAGRGALGAVGSWALALTTAAGAAAYVVGRTDVLLAGLCAAAVASAATALFRTVRRDGARGDRVERRVLWASVVAGALAASWAVYFRLFTIGFAEETVARRLVLTLAWMVVGVALVIFAREGEGERRGVREAGLVFVAAALLKVVGYDTTHLHGGLRIAALVGSGGVLAIGAALLGRVGRARALPAREREAA